MDVRDAAVKPGESATYLVGWWEQGSGLAHTHYEWGDEVTEAQFERYRAAIATHGALK